MVSNDFISESDHQLLIKFLIISYKNIKNKIVVLKTPSYFIKEADPLIFIFLKEL